VAAAVLRLVIAGGTYFPCAHAHITSGEQAAIGTTLKLSQNHLRAKLTLRERAVIDCLGRGAPNKIIAHELNMSVSTVKAHVHNIIRKLNVKNRTGVAMATRTAELGTAHWAKILS
jgi:DNA-binding NarL/FixJ family response regulator